MSRNNHIVNPLARDALDRFKYEVADELGLMNKINTQGWGEMTTREVGKIGGNMVKEMIRMAEEDMVRKSSDR